jgi:predicted permease
MLAASTRTAPFVYRRPGSAVPRLLAGQLVSANYFSLLGVPASRGRLLTSEDDELDRPSAVAVISDGFAGRIFGSADSGLGQSIRVNNVIVTVVGVTPPGFGGLWSDAEPDMWLPIALQRQLHYANNSSVYGPIGPDQAWARTDLVAWLNVFGRVPRAARAQVAPILEATNQQAVRDLTATFTDPRSRRSMEAHRLVVEPFAQGFSGLRARFGDALFALSALVVLVLLATCANLANLLLARAAGRERDISIRVSLGATTSRLVRQYLTESLTLGFIGGIAGLVSGFWCSRLLAHEVLGKEGSLPPVFSLDRRVLLFTIGTSLLTAVAFGLFPARRAIRAGRTAASDMTQRLAVGHAGIGAMRSLVMAQVALSAAIVFAALLFGRTLVNFMRIDPGFAIDRHVTASFDSISSGYTTSQMPDLARSVVAAARRIPGVISAAASRCGLIGGCSSSSGFHIGNRDDRRGVTLNENWITPRYFETVGIRFVAGRDFDDHDLPGGASVAIINESIARSCFPGQDPIGRRLGSSALDIEIVGIVTDARTQSLHDLPVPMVYFPIGQSGPGLQSVALTSLDVRTAGDPAGVASQLRDAIQQAEPNLLLSGVGVMSARVKRDLSRERVIAYLAIGFGALTVLLASLGLYGVLSYTVARRTQEIGVRLALGARRGEILRLILGQSARVTSVGIAVGILCSMGTARYLSRLLFGVTPTDAATFIAVGGVFAIVTLTAALVPARRAMTIDPVVALRRE